MQVTIVDLRPYYGFLKVSGADACSFLQGQLTCDVQKITQDRFQLGGHCNLKGRLRSLFRIYKKNEDFYLQAPLSHLDFAAIELKKYAKFSKVSISNESKNLQAIGCIGIEDLEKFQAEYSLQPNLHPNLDFIKAPHSPQTENRYQIIGPEAEITHLMQLLPKNQMQNFEYWKLADIQDGLPEVWPELSEVLLPHHIQLPKLGGVSFTKGCYCGQEIVARMEYRGNIKKTMVRACINTNNSVTNNHNPSSSTNSDTILPGTILYMKNSDGSVLEVGLVITAAKTPIGNIEMLLEITEALIPKEMLTSITLHFGSLQNPKQVLLFDNNK